ncbi:MAG: hypothetical protein KGQ52_04490 [Alphaproteobacteria bacterium]|nr:hypothetical protein [Alphaproteobacteria bacterium]
MARNNDPLIETLMQLAVTAAPLIRKARDSGIFRTDSVMEAEIVRPEAPRPPEPPKADAAPETPAAPAAPDASMAAMQDIIVRQALRINALEAEVAALKAAAETKA